jgi:hypothetical protein
MNRPFVILALLVALTCCQAVPAQQSGRADAVRSSPGYSQLTVDNEAGSLVLVVGPDGEVTALHQGTVVPDERLRREGDRLSIVDEDGTVLYEVRLLPAGGVAFPYDARVADVSSWLAGEAMSGWTTWSEPRKIIGVTVNPVDDVLASQLDLESDSAFVISTVTPGLPASKAGLQPHDVVIEIDGESPATIERLREVLDAKELDGIVELTVLRRRERIELDVGIAENSDSEFFSRGAFAPEASAWGASAEAYAELAAKMADETWRRSDEIEAAHERLTELRGELEEAVASMHEAQARVHEGGADAEARAAAAAELAERQAEVETMRNLMAEQHRSLESQAAGMRLLDLAGGGRALVVPPNSSAFGGGMAPPASDPLSGEVGGRLKSMEERLARLEELLEKLVESDAGK